MRLQLKTTFTKAGYRMGGQKCCGILSSSELPKGVALIFVFEVVSAEKSVLGLRMVSSPCFLGVSE
jgi:hypothetical protein